MITLKTKQDLRKAIANLKQLNSEIEDYNNSSFECEQYEITLETKRKNLLNFFEENLPTRLLHHVGLKPKMYLIKGEL